MANIIKEFFTGYKGKDIPKELNDFNWGAFLLTFIWGIKHRAWITLLAIPFIWIQLPFGFNWILYTALQFYCGFRGNMWAYQVDWWMSPKDFRKSQAKWAIAAISLNIFIPILLLGIALRFVKKSPDNPTEIIKNTQCYIASTKINKAFKTVSLNSSTTENMLAESFGKRFPNATVDGNKVNFSVKHSKSDIDAYYIEFSMSKKGEICSIPEKNCVIYSSFNLPEEINFSNDCKFYFDNNKNVIPDEYTQKAIRKNFNIFKYL